MLSQVCTEKGGKAMSVGLWNGCNLATKSGKDKAAAEIFDKRPRHTWISAPCTAFCSWQAVNECRYPVTYDKTYRRGKRILHNCSDLGELSVALGGECHDEHPLTARSWPLRRVKRFRKVAQYSARLDSCTVAFRHYWSRLPILKSFRIVSALRKMAAALDRCCTGGHQHHVLSGRDAVYHSGFYTRTMCNLIVGVVLAKPQWHDIREQNHVCEFSSFVHTFAPEYAWIRCEPEAYSLVLRAQRRDHGIVEPTLTGAQIKELDEKLLRNHDNLGHPPNAVMAKHLRLSGAREIVCRRAEVLRFPACEEMARPKERRPAVLVETPRNGHVVESDVIEWAHPITKVKHVGIMSIDRASHFAACQWQMKLPEGRGGNLTSEMVRSWFACHWWPWIGRPRIFRMDLEGAMASKAFQDWLARQNVLHQPVPAGAHWQLSSPERTIETIKDMLNTMLKMDEKIGADELLGRFGGI